MADEPLPRYNEAARYAFKNIYTEGFLRFLVLAAFAHWKYNGWVDSQVVSFPSDPERRCDTVAEFIRIDRNRIPVALAVEFETAPTSDIYPREGEYCLRLRREVPFHVKPGVPYDVVGAIVFLTGPRQMTLWRMQPDDFCGLGMTIECAVPCFRDMDVMDVLGRIARLEETRSLIVYAPLMAGSDTSEAAIACRELIKREHDPRIRKDMAAITSVMAKLNPRAELWKTAFQEIEMDANTAPFLVEFIQKGKAESFAEMRRELLADLASRLGSPVPENIRIWTEAQHEGKTITKWCLNAWRCTDWDAVRKMVGMPPVA